MLVVVVLDWYQAIWNPITLGSDDARSNQLNSDCVLLAINYGNCPNTHAESPLSVGNHSCGTRYWRAGNRLHSKLLHTHTHQVTIGSYLASREETESTKPKVNRVTVPNIEHTDIYRTHAKHLAHSI